MWRDESKDANFELEAGREHGVLSVSVLQSARRMETHGELIVDSQIRRPGALGRQIFQHHQIRVVGDRVSDVEREG